MHVSVASLVAAACILAGAFCLLWAVSLWLRKASIVDIFWSLGFFTLALFYWARGGTEVTVKAIVVLAAVALWSLRLAGYLAWRSWGEAEDRRYRAMRESWGRSFWWVSLFTVFFLQAFLIWLIAMPLYVIFTSAPRGWSVVDTFAALLFAVGFVFEAVADWQLARFKQRQRDPGAVLRTGLWRYSRHPNYFGEALVWWSFYLFSLGHGGWWTLFSPVLMTYLLLRVSGVALLEGTLLERKREYQEYVQTTSAFVPRRPRKLRPRTTDL